ncbi:B-cell receptor-associated protein 31-like [Varroa jacobsoni]|uniref:Endoplasmic reticulum transmembrane protein n=1 Tax=Varroa destructor TaxID=109461 RepID=A0A7M7MCR0_VARDE|nr:B-cell receptor-associated protein 31-like [Varroa destructor]XP_022652498.1 B-cell receptor-associated protein 31-like [Varroa destructor]XP_022652499.1 B-cell receptor-associated protein 31-like [Varroa destructor]XP_022690341.1 B-cell receptor-associated protein 31-like [Varroa jacobsoni]
MSLQWTFVAGFLYAEIIIVVLLLLPFISPKIWSNLFKSRFLKSFAAQANLWFMVAIAILVLFFVDSVRDVVKYSAIRTHDHDHHHHSHMDVEMQHSMKMFRSQRNFYIAGFSLFLALVIRRLVSLITSQANLIVTNEVLVKQAQNAAAAAQAALERQNAGSTNSENDMKELRKKLDEKEKDLAKAIKDKEAMKAQALNLQKQYDELCEELNATGKSDQHKKSA